MTMTNIVRLRVTYRKSVRDTVAQNVTSGVARKLTCVSAAITFVPVTRRLAGTSTESMSF